MRLPKPARILVKVLHRLLMVPLLADSLRKYSVFIFTGSSSFLSHWDLYLLKLFKKRIIVVFHGSDARPPYINGKYVGFPPHRLKRETRRVKRRVERIEALADVIVNHPPSAQFHRRPFVRYMALGMPMAFKPQFYQGVREHESKAVRIVHAPSHPEGKGTPRIREAIENLRGKGYQIDLIELINVPNSRVLEELAHCDFVVDEIYSDAVMAKFASEAAVFGKPSVVGGYPTNDDWQEPAEAMPPVFHCHPNAVESAIETLICDFAYRQALGEQAKRFVDTRWDASVVAERYMRLVTGDIPPEWLCEPDTIRYVHGWGLTEARLQELVKPLVTAYGESALHLQDKPKLTQRLMSLITLQGV